MEIVLSFQIERSSDGSSSLVDLNRRLCFIRTCLIFAASAVLFLNGCGSHSSSSQERRQSQADYDAAKAFLERNEYQKAADAFERAIATGGIDPDQLGQAYCYRAIALAELGRFDAAEAEMNNAEQGADQELVERTKEKIADLKTPS